MRFSSYRGRGRVEEGREGRREKGGRGERKEGGMGGGGREEGGMYEVHTWEKN